MKRLFLIFVIIVFSNTVFGDVFKDIKTQEDAKKMYEYYKDIFSKIQTTMKTLGSFVLLLDFMVFTL